MMRIDGLWWSLDEDAGLICAESLEDLLRLIELQEREQ